MRVVIAEDNPLLRDGIALILTDNDIDLVAAVSNAEDLLAATEQHRPDLAIVDVRMPPTHTDEGIRAALTIRADFPDVSVLVFSQWIELTYARQLLASPAKVGYLLKDRVISTDEFIAALHRVADGGTALDPEVVRQLLTRPAADRGLQRLTDRERSVLALLAEGRTNQAIATHEHLAIRSVEKVIASIFDKLDLADDAGAHRRVLAVLRYLNTPH
jgi:DNA-binding NarL/FixJ family response regulator